MRWLRLVLGVYMAFQAVALQDTFSGVFAAFFLFQAFSNVGCCGVGGCAVPMTPRKQENSNLQE